MVPIHDSGLAVRRQWVSSRVDSLQCRFRNNPAFFFFYERGYFRVKAIDNTVWGYGKKEMQENSSLCRRTMSFESAQEPPSTRSSFLCRDERSGNRL